MFYYEREKRKKRNTVFGVSSIVAVVYEIYYSVEMDLTVQNKYNNKTISSGLTKKYYKIPYRQDIDEIQKIDNYNDTAIQEELDNIINGQIKEILATPSKNNNYKYGFLNL